MFFGQTVQRILSVAGGQTSVALTPVTGDTAIGQTGKPVPGVPNADLVYPSMYFTQMVQRINSRLGGQTSVALTPIAGDQNIAQGAVGLVLPTQYYFQVMQRVFTALGA
jgi:hypothetical protein